MRILANEAYIQRRERLGRYGNLAGMALLALALTFSCTGVIPEGVAPFAMTGSAVVGLSLYALASFYGERYSGPMAHHLVIRKALKGMDRRHTLLQHILPAPNALLGPDGLLIIVARSQGGEISYRDGKWHHKQRAKLLRQLSGQERVGQPEDELEFWIDRTSRYLAKNQPDLQVPLRGVVVFTHPEVELQTDDPPIPALRVDKLKGWLRGPGKATMLDSETLQRLEQELVAPHLEESEQEG
jgi:hypothetical protein